MIALIEVMSLIIQWICAVFQWYRSRRYPALRPMAAWQTALPITNMLIDMAPRGTALSAIGEALFVLTLVGLSVAAYRYARWTLGAARRRKL